MFRPMIRMHDRTRLILAAAALAWLVPVAAPSGALAQTKTSTPAVQLRRVIVSPGGQTVTIAGDGSPIAEGVQTGAPSSGSGQQPPQQKNELLEAFKRQPIIRTASAMLERTQERAALASQPAPVGPPQNENEVLITGFQEAVLDGDWRAVAQFMERFNDSEQGAKDAFMHLLNSMVAVPQPRPPRNAAGSVPPPPLNPNQPPPMILPEPNLLAPQDILALADASPVPLDTEIESRIAQLLQAAMTKGYAKEQFLGSLEFGTRTLGGNDPERRLAAARVLVTAGLPSEAEGFLPTAEEARLRENADALNLRSRVLAARHEAEGELALLEAAWEATQDVLALPPDKATNDAREEALTRAIELAPKVGEQLGKAWLLESFTTNPRRGIEILASLGNSAAVNRGQFDPDFRRRILELQHRAVEALIEAAPARLAEWSPTLTLLALNWLHEGELSLQMDQSTTRGPQLRYDRFGNVYYADDQAMQQQMMMAQNNRQPQPIPTGRVLEVAPGATWRQAIDPALNLRFLVLLAELNLKVYDDEAAFPLLEQIASSRPDEGKRLAERFLSVWTDNHDPNQNQRRTNRFMYVYGYNPGMDAIPLTRSKQERNLAELAEWVKRLRALPIEGLDESLVAQAFVRTHSNAEVYRLDNIEKVFGPAEELAPATLSELAQTMRRNLGTVWRSLKVQQEAKTKRTDKEMLAEVERGYGVAQTLVSDGRAEHPDDWRLQLAHASLLFDRNNFESENIGRSPEFSSRRDAAFAAFAKAAELYMDALPALDDTAKSADVYLSWFYASLGATDLEAVKHDQQPDPRQFPLIQQAILALPGEAAEDHMTRFANTLSTRINAVQPELKHRYLGAGLQIAGDHERASDARNLYDYYSDLVSEVQLQTYLDGPDTVGHAEPFGLYVNIRHTEQIEREAGGFNRYLQNQNNYAYYYNFGRPNENYRDKFEESTREALAEHFDVLSITFHSDKIQSRGDAEDGWRVTPYAHILLKPKGPEVDAVPALEMNLDFLDTSGYVVLPIASPKIPIDARPASPEPRPFRQLEITQILDERNAADGVLGLEIKATAHGLVPGLDRVLDLAPDDFEVESIEDQGVAVAELDAESEDGSVITERLWNVSMKAKPELPTAPTGFQFASAAPAVIEPVMHYFRYEDADLAAAEPTVSLESEYVDPSLPWQRIAVAAGAALLLAVLVFLAIRAARRPRPTIAALELPAEINPLTVIGLLRRIREMNRLTAEHLRELDQTIVEIENRFYQPHPGSTGGLAVEDEAAALEKTAREWLRRAA